MNRPGRQSFSLSWLEIVLIIIFIVIIGLILYELLWPYLQTQVFVWCEQFGLPCKAP